MIVVGFFKVSSFQHSIAIFKRSGKPERFYILVFSKFLKPFDKYSFVENSSLILSFFYFFQVFFLIFVIFHI